MNIKNIVNSEENRTDEKQKVVIYFFIYAILGWILETIFCLVTLGEFTKRGFLYGPLCPMYGFAAVSMIQLIKRLKTNTIGMFFMCMITFTIFEYIVAVILESLFGLRWWDYSNEVLNFQGRISLPYSIAWGIIGVIFIEKIHPYVKRKVDKYFEKSSKNIQIIIAVLVLYIMIDFILSIYKYVIKIV